MIDTRAELGDKAKKRQLRPTMPDSAAREQFLAELAHVLSPGKPRSQALEAALEKILAGFDCRVGTIHALQPDSGVLSLQAQRGLPAVLLPRVQEIPIGKGMAGLAAERREPVQVCNLQTDGSGVAKPAARETQMEGSIAVPMLAEGALCGTLGVAKPVAHEFTSAETELLLKAGSMIGSFLRQQSDTAANVT
jgi:L-methionine (R)-S-oxide reductase